MLSKQHAKKGEDMKRFFIVFSLFLTMLLPLSAFAGIVDSAGVYLFGSGYVPACAKSIVSDLDKQLLALIGKEHSRSDLKIIFTVPVNLHNFNQTNGLSRQVAEEISNELKSKGYKVFEYRKGKQIEIVPKRGEFFLSREMDKMAQSKLIVELIMVGTYTISEENVRYNIRLLHAASNEVVASGNGTIPIYPEIIPLLQENSDELPDLAPSVKTKL